MDDELRSLGAVPSDGDPCVYVVQASNVTSFIVIYVDDILIMSGSEVEIERLKSCLCQKFEVKDLGDFQYCLGVEFDRTGNYLTISQRGYIDDLLEKFDMSHCNQGNSGLWLFHRQRLSIWPN